MPDGDEGVQGAGALRTGGDRRASGAPGPSGSGDLPTGDLCLPSVLGAPLDEGEAATLAAGFAALADPVRLRLLSMLAAAPGGEVCVCEVVEPLGRSQPTVSHHLKVLGDAGLVRGERRGRWVWYALDGERLAALRSAIDT